MVHAIAGSKELIVGGRYRVIRALATGGMGTVYEAENLRTRRRVAIKTIRPEVAERVSIVQRFEREARAAGQLRHPNIVDVLDLGDDPENQMLFIVQEFLVGGDLSSCLRECGPLRPRVALATLLPIMDALCVAHAQGVVHRDIKPDNIFLHETPQGVVPKLIDFGIAKIVESPPEARRRPTNSLVGSPVYMSPEQACADETVDARADVWSMGVVFYEALTGRTPYEGASAFSLFTKIVVEAPAALAKLAPDLPVDLVAAIQRAVTKDRAARWPTMAAFAAALRACELWRGVEPSRAATWIARAAGAAAAVPSRAALDLANRTTLDMSDAGPSSAEESRGQGSGLWTGEVSHALSLVALRRLSWPQVIGLVLLVVAVIGGVAVTNGRDGDTPAPTPAVRPAPAVVVPAPADLVDAPPLSALASDPPFAVVSAPGALRSLDAGVPRAEPAAICGPPRASLTPPAPTPLHGFNRSPHLVE